ncbi:HK97 family phage prohead protease [Micromonospora aurantiaca (nom. illeg.)]|uniref:hypothetical protein n=1 Tax=Micromonospora aurantiaca (nom. illeg.) TaxID=47850 RepID=UPI0033D2BFEB
MTRLVKAAAGPARVGSPSGSGDGAVATVSAVIAVMTPGLVDHDGDAYDPGAFGGTGQVLISQWGHSAMTATMPVGVGSIQEVGDQAVLDGVIWLGMQAGRDLYEVLRRRGVDQEWSYGYRVTKSRPPDPALLRAGARQVIQQLEAYEASPVWRGAGIGTHTVAVAGPTGGPAGGADLDPATRAELAAIGERLRGRRDAQEALAAAAVRLIRHQAERRRAASR